MQKYVNLVDLVKNSNEYLFSKIGFDTAECEPSEVSQNYCSSNCIDPQLCSCAFLTVRKISEKSVAVLAQAQALGESALPRLDRGPMLRILLVAPLAAGQQCGNFTAADACFATPPAGESVALMAAERSSCTAACEGMGAPIRLS